MGKKRNSDYEMELKCAKRPEGSSMAKSLPCFAKVHDKMCFKILIFLLVLILDAADVASDWMLYRDVSATEEGLVYGPTEDLIKYLLLGFSIVGTVIFIFEVSNLWSDIFRDRPWMDIDLMFLISVWVEDVPQIAINIAIVACREEAISYFQLVKASVVIVGVIIRLMISIVRYCNKKARHDLQCAKYNPSSRRHVIYRVVTMIGLILTLGGAVTIFVFTQSERNPDGSLNFKIPHSVLEGEYDDKKYFNNVSVYFSHPLFDYDSAPKTTSDINLVKLVSINDIKHSPEDTIVKISYDKAGRENMSKLVIQAVNLTNPSCFEMDHTNKKLNIKTNCSDFITTSPSYEFVFQFHYKTPSVPRLLFGDIKYHVKLLNTSDSNCETLNLTIKNHIEARIADKNMGFLHYYRNKAETGNVKSEGDFYRDGELTDIVDVWRTGFTYCRSSGSTAPHHDPEILVTC